MVAKYSMYCYTQTQMISLYFRQVTCVRPISFMATVIEFIIEPLNNKLIIQLYPQLGEYVPI